MQRAGLIIMALIAFAFGLMMEANVIPVAIDETLSEDYAENYSVVTSGTQTSTIATLTYDHYYGDLTNLSASTNLPADDPYVMSYTVPTKQVTVDGLATSGTRIMTIDYVRETDNSMFFGWGTFCTIIPFLIGLGLLAMLARSFWT